MQQLTVQLKTARREQKIKDDIVAQYQQQTKKDHEVEIQFMQDQIRQAAASTSFPKVKDHSY